MNQVILLYIYSSVPIYLLCLLILLYKCIVEVRRGASQCIGHVCRYVTKCSIEQVCTSVYELAMSTFKVRSLNHYSSSDYSYKI